MPAPRGAAVLLHFVRALIGAGREHLAAVRSRPAPGRALDLAHRFGTFSLTLIVARILRGLRLAAALEQRVIAEAADIDAPPCVAPRPNVRIAASSPGPSGAPRPPRAPRAFKFVFQDRDESALLARAPTDLEIAEMIRGRTLGEVLVDICADLGIGAGHPLWREVELLIIYHDGPIVNAMKRGFERVVLAQMEVDRGLVPDGSLYSAPARISYTTGPPRRLAAA